MNGRKLLLRLSVPPWQRGPAGSGIHWKAVSAHSRGSGDADVNGHAALQVLSAPPMNRASECCRTVSATGQGVPQKMAEGTGSEYRMGVPHKSYRTGKNRLGVPGKMASECYRKGSEGALTPVAVLGIGTRRFPQTMLGPRELKQNGRAPLWF